MLIETYLQRRAAMDPTLRDQMAYKIALRITEKTGLQRDPSQSLDDFLKRHHGRSATRRDSAENDYPPTSGPVSSADRFARPCPDRMIQRAFTFSCAIGKPFQTG